MHAEPETPYAYRQRGMTISLPTTGTSSGRPGYVRQPSNPAECEPPACPADIPISPPKVHFPGPKAAMTVEHGGTMRASSYRELDLIEPVVASAQQMFHLGADSQRTWHSGCHMGTQLSKLPTQNWTHDTSVGSDLFDPPIPSNHETSSVCESKSHSTLRRRISHWFSRSLSSLKRRLRSRPLSNSTPPITRHHTAEPCVFQSTQPDVGPRDSTSSEPVVSRNSKSRRWFSFNKEKINERKDKQQHCPNAITVCSTSRRTP